MRTVERMAVFWESMREVKRCRRGVLKSVGGGPYSAGATVVGLEDSALVTAVLFERAEAEALVRTGRDPITKCQTGSSAVGAGPAAAVLHAHTPVAATEACQTERCRDQG